MVKKLIESTPKTGNLFHFDREGTREVHFSVVDVQISFKLKEKYF